MKIKLLEAVFFKDKQLKAFFVALLCLISSNIIQAQSITLSGTVTGNGMPLAGTSIVVKGTSIGTMTDFDGNYQISTNVNDILQFRYLGYIDQDIKVAGETTINIVLKEDFSTLDEVVVIGYGTVKKKELTGAVSQISSEVISKTATSDLGVALQGQLAGVNVTASDGSPGSAANIIIRGISSINASNSPLYVVDGIPQEGDPRLSINEIEKIDVLKDAASAAIYGTRGSGGVILITTKQGRIGQLDIKIDSYYAIQKIISRNPRLTTEESIYTELIRNTSANPDKVYGNTWINIQRGLHQLTNNTNIEAIALVDNAPIQNHNVSISGGREGLTYSVNGAFFSQDGALVSSGYERFNLRANSQLTKGKWKITTGLSMRVEDQDATPWQVLGLLSRYKPWQQNIDPDVDIVISPAPVGQNQTESLNRNVAAFKNKNNRKGEMFNASINATYNITNGLDFTFRGSALYDNNTTVLINPLFVTLDIDGKVLPPNERSKIENKSDRRANHTAEAIVQYNKQLGNHNIKLTAAYSAERYTYSYFFASRQDIINNDVVVLNGALNDPNAGSGTNQWNQDRTNSLNGILGRIQYNYKGKYLLSVSARRDGSSRFAASNRWETFPSVSIGWNASDEKFWEPLKNMVNTAKFRMSRGTVGNQGVADYAFQPTIILNNNAVFGAGDDEDFFPGSAQEAFTNGSLKWETSISTNFGYDLSFLSNSLTLSADIYNTKKEDMLFPLLIPGSTGRGGHRTVVLNIGDMENKGIEYGLTYKHKGTFSWNANFTYASNKNRITDMGGTNNVAFLDGSRVVPGISNEDLVTVIAEGQTAGVFRIYKTNGIVSSEEELAEYKLLQPNAKLGDLRIVDSNTVDTNADGIPDAGDGILNEDDKQFLGSGTPDFELGLNLSANYKNFDFTMQWYGSFGAEVMNGNKASAYKYGTHKDLLYQWTPQNPTSLIPTDRGRDHDNYRGQTDYFLEDGDFIRLRNIQLGYTIPKKIIEKINISKLRIYAAAQNALTITEYTGFDPEVGNNGLSSRGIDAGSYPILAQVRVGIQLQF